MKHFLALIVILICPIFSFADENLAKLPKNFSASFLQTRKIAALESEVKLKGELKVANKDLIWSITEPFDSKMLYISGKVYQFEDSKEVPADQTTAKVLEQIYSIVLGAILEDSNFTIQTFGKEKTTLTPKSNALKNFIKRIDIFYQKDSVFPQKVEIFSPNGDENRIEFSKFSTTPNSKISLNKK